MRRILVLFLLLVTGSTRAAIQDFDLVVANGRVIDPESGLDAVRSVGVRGGSIAAIEAGPLRGRTVIDATGLVVAPGFIDVHRHGQNDENYRHAALDGVTSSLELEVGTRDIESWYRERAPGRLIHYGVSIGHIGVRMAVMGDAGDFLPSGPAASAAATPEQVAEMARRLDEGLRQGAVAVGFGTAYTPAASPWEVLEMFRVAGRHGASAHIHVRRGVEGVQEALANAVVTGTPLHVVHINSTGGNDVGRMLALISEARQRGLDVTTEAYPSNRGHPRSTGTFSQVLGRYVREAKSLSLMDAVRKMTLMPARRLEARVSGMRNKGRLRVGADADVVVFDPVRVIDRSTYQQPAIAPEGIQHVLVTGVPVVADGRVIDGVAPGRAIRAAIAPR